MADSLQPSFCIGSVPVYGDLILSPMDGYSDLPFRSICRELGSAMSYTEFINAIDIVYRHPHVQEKMAYLPQEQPVVFQLFDNNPERMLQAAIKLRSYNPAVLDINLGCSARSVSGRGAGAGLLRTPLKIAHIFSQLTRELDIPVTAKIRLGWDDQSRNYLLVARIIEDNGGAMIAVHGRTRQQRYTGQADWNAIAEIRQAVHVPVIANGDVRSVADIDRIKAHTNCQAVMIGRAALENPWIFSRLNRDQASLAQVRQTVFAHLERSLEFYGPQRGLVLFRKYVVRYLRPYSIALEDRQRLLTCEHLDVFRSLLSDLLV